MWRYGPIPVWWLRQIYRTVPKVWLNSGSSLKHPVKFTGDTRTVELDGEAYFSVRKDRSKRFVVNTPFNIQTEVLGTEFNMEAYRTDSVVRTTLVSGSVRLSFFGERRYKRNIRHEAR